MRILYAYSVLGLVILAASNAYAGGFSRGSADTDILFEPGGFNMRSSATIVVPTQEISEVPAAPWGNPALVGQNYLDNYVIPSAAVKIGFGDKLACAGTWSQPFGADSSFSSPYGPSGKISEGFRIVEFGGTCAVFMTAGNGRLALLGGVFMERFDYDLESVPFALQSPMNVNLNGNAYGWRAGIAYEIPEIAFRTQLMYRSGTEHDPTGSIAIGGIPGRYDAFGIGELPQSVELKVRSGLAPRWLAFGSVKWTDWSINKTLRIMSPSTPIPGGLEAENEYYWRDGWTVTAGLGHSFSDNVSGQVSLQWDRGVATGYDLRGDKWLLAAGASLKDAIGGELRFAGGVSFLDAVEITQGYNAGYSVDSGWAGIVQVGYSVTW